MSRLVALVVSLVLLALIVDAKEHPYRVRISTGGRQTWSPFAGNLSVSISNGFLFGSTQHTLEKPNVNFKPRGIYFFDSAILPFAIDEIKILSVKYEPLDPSISETVDISDIQVTQFVVSSWSFSTKIFCLAEKEPLEPGKFYRASTQPGIRRCN